MDRAIHIGGSVNNLQNQLTSMRSECNAKDDHVIKHAKVAEAAIAGWEKAESEALYLKQELDHALRQRIAAEERISDLDAALKECMQQLRCSREEQDQRINDAVINICREHEQEWMLLEEMLGETSTRLANLDFENSHLSKTLQTKEKLIEDLCNCKSQVELNFNKLMARLDAGDKSSIRSADASYKQHKDSRKIMKLEKECQRLRLLLQKQLPGPATLGEMKSDILEKERDECDHQRASLMVKKVTSADSPSRKIDFLVEKLSLAENENKALKESILKKNNEIHPLRTKGAHNPSNLWSLPKGKTPGELARDISSSHEMSHSSFSENGLEDEISCSESWASALITELEQFTNRNPKGLPSSITIGITGMNMMDDFVEMEELAKSSMVTSCESSSVPLQETATTMSPLGTDLCRHPLKTSGKLIPNNHSGPGETRQGIHSSSVSIEKYPSWLQEIFRLILLQIHITQKHPHDILEDVRNALEEREHSGSLSSPDPLTSVDHISRSPSNTISLSQVSQSDVSKSICRMIELIEGIRPTSLMDHSSPMLSEGNHGSVAYKNSASSTGYIVRVFQWKSSELCGVLQRLLNICNDLINGKATLEDLPTELISAMEWISNHCFSIQDVSRMRDTVKKHFDWDESEGGSELECVMGSPQLDAERVQVPPSTAPLDGHNDFSQMEEIHLNVNEENMVLKQKVFNMESVQKDLEGKLQLATEKIEELLIKLRELEQKEVVENQTENPESVSSDLNSQITVARNELNVDCDNSLSLELELENKINRCQELETTCIELQLQLNSVAGRELEKCDIDQVNRKLQTDREITAASEKLAECQETILNLGKQLKSLASPKETAVMGKVVSASPLIATNMENAHQRSSLLDKLLSEDSASFKEFTFLKEKHTVTSMVDAPRSLSNPSNVPSVTCDLDFELKSKEKLNCPNNRNIRAKAAVGHAVAHPSQMCGGVSLLKKILLRRRPESGKKSITMVA